MSGTALGKDKLSKDPQVPFTQGNLCTACEHMIHESSSSDSKEKMSFFSVLRPSDCLDTLRIETLILKNQSFVFFKNYVTTWRFNHKPQCKLWALSDNDVPINFINFNKWAILVGEIDKEEDYARVSSGTYREALYLPLSFPVNLKWLKISIYVYIYLLYIYMGFPGSSAGKESTCDVGHPSLIPGSRGSLMKG